MDNLYKVLSLLFFTGTGVSIYWGYYAIKNNFKSLLNKANLLIVAALAIWSFGFGMANIVSIEKAIFWRRFASIGMTTLFSFVLIFVILLTNKEKAKKYKNYLLPLFIPALISFYAFVISNKTASVLYDLVKLDVGLTNIAQNTIWNYIYYAYYLVYAVVSMVLLFKWRKKANNKNKIKQANYIILGMIAALIVSTIIDVFLTSIGNLTLPQMAPLFSLLPVWALHYSVKHHNILTLKETNYEEEIIATKKQERILLSVFAMGIITSGLFSFVFSFFATSSNNNGDLLEAIINGSILFVVGFSLLLTQSITNNSIREKLTILIFIFSIPLIVFQFFEFSSVTLWVYPLLIIMSALLYRKRTLLNFVTFFAVLTQLALWLLKPETVVIIDKYDYILRIFIIIMVFSLGTYLNKVYLNKIKENNYQINFQKLVSKITLEIVDFDKVNTYNKTEEILKMVGQFFNADRTYIFTINNKRKTMTYANEWCADGVNNVLDRLEDVPLNNFTWWIDELYKNNYIYLENTDQLPITAKNEKEELLKQEIKSLITVPVMVDGLLTAFIGMDIVVNTKKWDKEVVSYLKIIANILSSVFTPLQISRETEFRAYNDSLTRLPNRYLFYKKVNSAINVDKDNKVAIIFVDLDNFKDVNDTYGHIGGDLLLQQIATKLKQAVRKTDIVSRFGGDEFIVLLDNITTKKEVKVVADRIIAIFDKAITFNKQNFLVTASAGISIYPNDGKNADELIKNADIAMYKAKSTGKNHYLFCTEEMKHEVAESVLLTKDLSTALDKKQFELYYQPQVDVNTNEIVSVEALLRWNHPKRGIIAPNIFIPLLENSTLINDVGVWVLETATKQVKKWHDQGLKKVRLSVNISPVQLSSSNVVKRFAKIIERVKLETKYIKLEITETAIIDGNNCIVKILDELVALGLSIAIDDFGVKYSSLNRLKTLPIEQIKIDMSFIRGIEKNEKDRAIVMIIINLAKKLGLKALAEGVETKAELDFLIKEGCNYIQGYYFYKPMPVKEMLKVLKQQKK